MKGTGGDNIMNNQHTWAKCLGLLVVLALLTLVNLHGYSQTPARELVADVIPQGNASIPTEKVMRFIHTRPGMEYNASRLYDDVTRLSASRMFKNVRVREDKTPSGVVIYFVLQEYPNLVQEVIYKNANHISEKDLEGMSRIRKGMPLDPVTNKQACFEIQEYLKKKGRYFANVTLEEGDKKTDHRVVFNVSEGPVVFVGSLNFQGNSFVTAQRLRTQIDSTRTYLGLFSGKFNPAIIDNDMVKLEEYYKANGFHDVKVNRELIFTQDYRGVDVIFHIHEGTRYIVKDVVVEGAKEKPNLRFQPSREEVSSIVQVKRDEYYNESTVSGDVRNITDYYGWRGYPVNVQKDVFMVPNEPGVVRVQYQVQERAPTKVGQIIITGNEVTQERVIRRLLGLYPGQTLRYPELRIGEANLQRANIFEINQELGIRPTVSVLDPDGEGEYKDVLVSVKETHTGSLMFGAGVNSNAGLVGSIVLNERNFDICRFPTSWADVTEGRAFRGAGQEFRIEAVPGTQLQRYTVSWRDPFIFDRPYSLSTSAYFYDRVFNEYTENRFGGRINVAHQFSKAWSANVGVRIENVGVSNVGAFAPTDYTSVLGSNFLIAPRIGATYDTRDSFLRPTAGGIMDVSYEQAFGAYTFPLLNADYSRYFTTYQRADGSGKHVLAARSQVSWAGSQTPVYERYFAGGFNSLRGFQFRGVGPNKNGYMVGGDFMFLNSLEYQIPIKANDQLYLVGFLDTGTVESSFNIKDYRVSAGVGLRITIPMLGPVPIALDFGFPINRKDTDQTQVFNFWVGMFR